MEILQKDPTSQPRKKDRKRKGIQNKADSTPLPPRKTQKQNQASATNPFREKQTKNEKSKEINKQANK